MQNHFNSIVTGALGTSGSLYWLYNQAKDFLTRFEFSLDISFFDVAVFLFTLFITLIFANLFYDGWKRFSIKKFLKYEPWGMAIVLGLVFDLFIFALTLIYENGLVSKEILSPLIPLVLFTLIYQGLKRYELNIVFSLISIALVSASVIAILYLVGY